MRFLTFIRSTALLVLIGSALGVINWLAAHAGGWFPHAATHLTGAIVGMMPLSIAVWHARHAGQPVAGVGRIAVRAFIAGAALFTISQVVETFSAVIEYPDAGNMHTVSGLTTMMGLLILCIGGLMLLFTAVTGRRLPRWTLLLAIVGGSFVLVAAVFGIG